MKRCLMTVCLAAVTVSAALAQQKKTAPALPKPDDNAPSLEVTAKFIQEKLADQGAMNYVLYVRNNQSGQNDSAQYSFEATSFNLDPAKCTFERHYKIGYNGGSLDGAWNITPLGSVKQLEVMPASNWWTQELADEGHPMKTARVEPSFFILSLGHPRREPGEYCMSKYPGGDRVACPDFTWMDRLGMTWSFRDEDSANRVAKAIVHAVELCGGGSKPEPF
jgi:hypothetical protein